MHAVIVKCKHAYLVFVDGDMVDVGRTAYQAAEIAAQYGAKKQELLGWETFFSEFTSAALSSQRGASQGTNRQKDRAKKTGSTN